ncbi:hypothetical protein AMATHDRAFT_4506 [Amanita thiersii Skay4041]|uniref:FYVE-type domain-containing protein n=1 Tax=Amanita thiersii Skay4041 TaxID=703135 RepID=A0A2A9NII3_9AGAR|nr:hypothetical protein AMATHDRAFT_4506 [Amanita thiersii Skay4041]
MSDTGMPLLSGPPPPIENLRSNTNACRKCNKEFNVLFARSRKCNHCGYLYCPTCSDYQALMPRTGPETGYSVVPVCGFCIEHLTITAGGKGNLRSLPLSKLRKYATAYNIKIGHAVEKDDIIEAILNARGPNGCLSPENERYYRKYSVPDRSSGRPRSFFSRSNQQTQEGTPTPPQPPPPRPPQHSRPFPRPDLEPDYPPPQQQQPYHQHESFTHQEQYQYPPPPVPPPPGSRPQYYHPQSPPSQQEFQESFFQGPGPQYQHQHNHNNHYFVNTSSYASNNFQAPPQGYGSQADFSSFGVPPFPQPDLFTPPQPPSPPYASRPAQETRTPTPPLLFSPLSQPGSRTPQSSPPRQPSSRQRTASSAAHPSFSSTAPPSLDQLLDMSPDTIRTLSIGTLKAILFANHVTPGLILEKVDLVTRVVGLVDDERRERERQRRLNEEEEERERAMLREEMERRAREERQRQRHGRESGEHEYGNGHDRVDPNLGQGGGGGGGGGSSPYHYSESTTTSASGTNNKAGSTPPSKSSVTAERSGLCVICQDEEANIAIVDCG